MRQFTDNQETTELLNELEANEIEYETREHNKIFVNVTNDDDELEGIWCINWYDYWGAFKMIYYFLDNNEIQSAKTVAWDVEQVIENILG